MQRIAIIGSSGSGKSTLALELHTILKLPLYHLDQYNWQPGWVARPFEEFSQLHTQLCTQNRWIIEGIYTRTFEERIKTADTIIYLDFSRIICIWRLLKRLYYYYNKPTPSSAPGCPERFDLQFLRYVWNFNRWYKSEIAQLLIHYRDMKTIYIFTKPQHLRSFLTTIKEKNEKIDN
jgi:adenylate kinase family enzyme